MGVCSLSCLIFFHTVDRAGRATSLLALHNRAAITFCPSIYFRAILRISVCYHENVNSKTRLTHIRLSRLPCSHDPSSLLLPAAPGPGGCVRSVRDSTMRHCGISGNGAMDQRWPGTGWRERPPRYDYFIISSASLLSLLLSVCLLLLALFADDARSH